MNFFDLHCDTIQCLLNGDSLADADTSVTLDKAEVFGRWAQVYAMFAGNNYPGKDNAYDTYRRLHACFQKQMTIYAERIVQCRTAAQIDEAFAAGKRAAILSVENGSVLGGRLDRLAEFQRDGVRLLTLTWMGENELGGGGDVGGPLKPFGIAVLKALPEYGILPDISHLSDEGVADVFENYDGPLVATHSNVRRVVGHHRNLTAGQIAEIVQRGGLIGINLCSLFLSSEQSAASCDDVYRHLMALLELGAQDTVCFGTDFDGAHTPAEIHSLKDIPALCDYLQARGLSEALLNKVFFENAYHFWTRNF